MRTVNLSILKSLGYKLREVTSSILIKSANSKGYFSRDMKLKSKMIISFFLIAVIPIVFIAGFSYLSAKNTIQSKITTYSDQLNTQIVTNANTTLSKKTDILQQIFIGSVMMDSAYANTNFNQTDDFDIIQQNQKKISDFFNAYMSVKLSLYGITYKEDDSSDSDGTQGITSYGQLKNLIDSKFYESDAYKKTLASKGDIVWIPTVINGKNMILCTKPMNTTPFLTKNHGVALIGFETSELNDLFVNLNLGKGTFVEVINTDGVILLDTSGESTGKMEDDYIISSKKQSGSIVTKENELVTFGTCSNGWKIAISTPTSTLFKELNATRGTTLVITIICIFLAIFVGVFVAYNISKPIYSIVELMKKAETGDFTVKSNYYGKNEVGMLAKSFNVMIGNIKSLITSTKSVVEEVVLEAKNITLISDISATTAEQVACAVGEIAKGTTDQAKESENVTNNMIKLSDKIESVTKNVTEVRKISANTQAVGSKSLNTVNILKQKSTESGNMMIEINDNVSSLNKSSKEIESIVKVLKGITDQTNLLSLNASIEAARAGDAGRGFEVVAQEVRKLAEQSKQSTEDIAKVILGIQHKVMETVDIVEKATYIFKEQEASVNDTNLAFTSIIATSTEVAKQVEGAQSLIEDMNDYKVQVVDAINNIASVSEESSASAEEVMATSQEQSSSAEELSSMAGKLNEIVEVLNQSIEKFKV